MFQMLSISPGNQGTRETLILMAALVRDAVNDNFFVVCSEWFPETPAMIDFMVRADYTYTDEEIETLYTPVYNMHRYMDNQDIIGDCDDVSMFLAALFTVRGYQSRFVAMRTKKHDPSFLHVVVEALVDSRWKRFDPTVQPGLTQLDYGQMIEYV